MPRGYSDVDQLPRERRGEVGICVVIFIKECVLAGDGLDAADKKHKHSTIKARNYYIFVCGFCQLSIDLQLCVHILAKQGSCKKIARHC
ncbi:hypothetical protein NC653_006372 [Populus alba x Populus x berolinensis]|uniref:Uncharacterized protein n=1 Tax=Populus alba x Populus x berolinensis TaxID=444605 RepID=A0AAD6REI4_9ROSI|nr:hypothetical protein NC653_006372 [Populus alba x Populus x berolinensis]